MALRMAAVSSGSGARPSRSLRLSRASVKAITARSTPMTIDAAPSQTAWPVAALSPSPAAATAMPIRAPVSS